MAARASRTAERSAGFLRGSASRPAGVRAAPSTDWSRRLVRREPVTRAATFCSSTTFQRMKFRMSG